MTKQESLFFAIGQLEESLLQQSECSIYDTTVKPWERNMKQRITILRHLLHNSPAPFTYKFAS